MKESKETIKPRQEGVDELRMLCIRAGFKYDKDIANQIGMSPAVYSNKLKGRRPFTTDDLISIGNVIGKSGRYIFTLLY